MPTSTKKEIIPAIESDGSKEPSQQGDTVTIKRSYFCSVLVALAFVAGILVAGDSFSLLHLIGTPGVGPVSKPGTSGFSSGHRMTVPLKSVL
jgi:hypothetical protein